jgi:phage lysozyme
MTNKTKYAVGTLAVSAAFFAAMIKHEGYRPAPYPDSGGVPTIGIGSTVYPDGRRVKMTDPPVTQTQAVDIARAHIAKDEGRLKALLPGVKLSQAEYDVYADFVYQYGADTFAKSSIRRHLLAGNHTEACRALLKYRYTKSRDCSVRQNGCWGVWTRQLERHNKCMEANR